MSSSNSARQRVGQGVAQFIRWSGTATGYAARRLKLNRTDMLCIRFLLGAGHSVSPKQITRELGLSSSTATELLDRLQAHGYIRRVPNPDDRRGVLIELDREGAREPLAYFTAINKVFQDALARRSEPELLAMAEFFEEVSASRLFDDQPIDEE